ncbi:MAG: hypothetical protein KAX40_07895 [Herpetosiphon sp.]|nr:hypothetical protein [Herpetosiphon sp.]
MQAKPRCILVYALAPDGVTPAQANQQINAITADPNLPLALFHDHFIGHAGGMIIFLPKIKQIAKNLCSLNSLQAGMLLCIR